MLEEALCTLESSLWPTNTALLILFSWAGSLAERQRVIDTCFTADAKFIHPLVSLRGRWSTQSFALGKDPVFALVHPSNFAWLTDNLCSWQPPCPHITNLRSSRNCYRREIFDLYQYWHDVNYNIEFTATKLGGSQRRYSRNNNSFECLPQRQELHYYWFGRFEAKIDSI